MDEERSLHIEGLIDHPPSRVLRGTGAPMNKLPDGMFGIVKPICMKNCRNMEVTEEVKH